MKPLAAIACAVCAACATPPSVLQADVLAREAHATVTQNVLTTVDALHAELVSVAAQGNAALLAERRKGITDVAAYDALGAQAAKAQEAAAKAFDAQIAPLRQTLESQLATERRLLDALAQYHRSAGNLQLQAVADIAREIKPEPKPATAVDWPRAMNLLINMGESYLAPKGP